MGAFLPFVGLGLAGKQLIDSADANGEDKKIADKSLADQNKTLKDEEDRKKAEEKRAADMILMQRRRLASGAGGGRQDVLTSPLGSAGASYSSVLG